MANSKTLLQTYCQERHLQFPVYSTERADGTSGYVSSVLVCDITYESRAIHSSIKLAEEDAARVAYNSLKRASESALKQRSNMSSNSGYDYTNASGNAAFDTAARRTGLASRPANASNTKDYSQELDSFCKSRDLSEPEYNVQESPDGKFTATVVIGKEEYYSNISESYVEAKNYASLIALAEISLNMLNINDNKDEENLQRSEAESRSPGPESNVHSPAGPTDYSTRSHVTEPELPDRNYKAIIQEYCQKNDLPLPEYVTEYPEYSTGFVSVVTVCDKEYQSKPMAGKKKAEQNVAGKAALDIGLVTASEREVSNSRRQVNSPGRTGSGVELTSRSASGVISSASSLASSIGGIRTTRTAAVPENTTSNYKGALQEFLNKAGLASPKYSTQQSYGGNFVSTVTLTDVSGETLHFQGKAYSTKKTAEQSATKQACIHYNIE